MHLKFKLQLQLSYYAMDQYKRHTWRMSYPNGKDAYEMQKEYFILWFNY